MVYTQAAAPHGPVVLLGWLAGTRGRRRRWPRSTGRPGPRPVLVEMLAHGCSRGATSNPPQFARAIEHVAARLYRTATACVPGGAFAGGQRRCLRRQPRPAHRAVMLAPPRRHASTRACSPMFGPRVHPRGYAEADRGARRHPDAAIEPDAGPNGSARAHRWWARPRRQHQPFCRRPGVCTRRCAAPSWWPRRPGAPQDPERRWRAGPVAIFAQP